MGLRVCAVDRWFERAGSETRACLSNAFVVGFFRARFAHVICGAPHRSAAWDVVLA